jgi:hypothetical protein
MLFSSTKDYLDSQYRLRPHDDKPNYSDEDLQLISEMRLLMSGREGVRDFDLKRSVELRKLQKGGPRQAESYRGDHCRTAIPLGYDVYGDIQHVHLDRHRNASFILVKGEHGMGKTNYAQWVVSSLSACPDEWSICVYDAEDDGLTSEWSFIRDARPRNAVLSDNLERDVLRIHEEAQLRIADYEAKHALGQESDVLDHVPSILLVLDMGRASFFEDGGVYDTVRCLLSERIAKLAHVYVMIISSDITYRNDMVRQLGPVNTVYIGAQRPQDVEGDKDFPTSIVNTMPRTFGLVSYTGDGSYHMAMAPNMTRKALRRCLEDHCWA